MTSVYRRVKSLFFSSSTDFSPIKNENNTQYVKDVDVLCLGSEVIAARLMMCKQVLNHDQILLSMQWRIASNCCLICVKSSLSE